MDALMRIIVKKVCDELQRTVNQVNGPVTLQIRLDDRIALCDILQNSKEVRAALRKAIEEVERG